MSNSEAQRLGEQIKQHLTTSAWPNHSVREQHEWVDRLVALASSATKLTRVGCGDGDTYAVSEQPRSRSLHPAWYSPNLNAPAQQADGGTAGASHLQIEGSGFIVPNIINGQGGEPASFGTAPQDEVEDNEHHATDISLDAFIPWPFAKLAQVNGKERVVFMPQEVRQAIRNALASQGAEGRQPLSDEFFDQFINCTSRERPVFRAYGRAITRALLSESTTGGKSHE